jgi:hypothetical protein
MKPTSQTAKLARDSSPFNRETPGSPSRPGGFLFCIGGASCGFVLRGRTRSVLPGEATTSYKSTTTSLTNMTRNGSDAARASNSRTKMTTQNVTPRILDTVYDEEAVTLAGTRISAGGRSEPERLPVAKRRLRVSDLNGAWRIVVGVQHPHDRIIAQFRFRCRSDHDFRDGHSAVYI